MASIGINIYSLRVYDKNGDELELHKIDGNKSIIDVFKEFFQDKMNILQDIRSKEESYEIADWEVKSYTVHNAPYFKSIYCRLKSGKYGSEADIVDHKSGKLIHKQTIDQAALKPFDLVVGLPEDDCQDTIIILQTISGLGIKGLLQTELNKYLINKYNISKIQLGPIYPKIYLTQYIQKGILKKMRLIDNDIPKDKADMFGVNKGKKKVKKETIISGGSGFTNELIGKVEQCIHGKLTYDRVVELPDMDEIDDVKLEFSLGGKKKVISLKNIERAVVSEVITEQIELDGGNPTKNSIYPVLIDNLKLYLVEKGYLEDIETFEETLEDHRTIEEEAAS